MKNQGSDFIMKIKEFFKLSTGTTALVGCMEPAEHPIITLNQYLVMIKNSQGKRHIFKHIGEDIFAKNPHYLKNRYRSLQTFDDIEKFMEENVILEGYRKT